MKKVKDTIHAKGVDISVYTEDFKNEYISLTDIAKYKSAEPRITIHTWLRSRDIVEFLGLWEALHNENFKRSDFYTFKKDAGTNAFTFSIKKWNDELNAIGILTKSGIAQNKRLEMLRATAERQLRTILGLKIGINETSLLNTDNTEKK